MIQEEGIIEGRDDAGGGHYKCIILYKCIIIGRDHVEVGHYRREG